MNNENNVVPFSANIEIRSVMCRSCNSPGGLNEHGDCFHCRTVERTRPVYTYVSEPGSSDPFATVGFILIALVLITGMAAFLLAWFDLI